MRDLGTWHVRVELTSGDGFILGWSTGPRFIGGGSGECWPLSSEFNAPAYENEDDLLDAMRYMFTDGNYGCDCNRKLFLARAHQQPEPDDPTESVCGRTLKIRRLTAIRPDGTTIDLHVCEEGADGDADHN